MKPVIGLRMHDTIPGSFREKAAFIRSQGFECVHLALSKVLGKPFMEPGALTPGLAARVTEGLDGLGIAVLGCYLDLTEPDEAKYAQILRKYTAHLRMSRWLNAGMVGTETGNLPKDALDGGDTARLDDAAAFFTERLVPAVRAAEKLGAVLAIEPVWRHSVRNAACARRVLDRIASPNLGIIFDPVNLIDPRHPEQAQDRIREAIDLLGDDILMIHLKDWVLDDEGRFTAVAAGTGRMDYTAVADFVRDKKPGIQITLENTRPDNAVQALAAVKTLLETEQ